jgi:hypothetical protein
MKEHALPHEKISYHHHLIISEVLIGGRDANLSRD